MRNNLYRKITRHKKIRQKISGNEKKPRLSIFRSNKYIYGQLIDDTGKRTLVAISSQKMGKQQKNNINKLNKIEITRQAGKQLAKLAIAKKIKKVVFDRGGYKYHGRVRAFAEGAREGGLIF